MIYQGIINTASGGGRLWVVWLIAAMFGSVLTLAGFMKLIHTVFLGQQSREIRAKINKIKEAGPSMLIPVIALAILCVIFGVFAYSIPLRLFIFPALGESVPFSGVWNAGLATLLIIAGIIVGALIYLFGTAVKARETDPFVGGEDLKQHPDMRVSGTEFYNTIHDVGYLKRIYWMAEKKFFDIYEVGTKITFGFNKVLRYIHNGVLSSYLAWCLLGMAIFFYILLKE